MSHCKPAKPSYILMFHQLLASDMKYRSSMKNNLCKDRVMYPWCNGAVWSYTSCCKHCVSLMCYLHAFVLHLRGISKYKYTNKVVPKRCGSLTTHHLTWNNGMFKTNLNFNVEMILKLYIYRYQMSYSSMKMSDSFQDQNQTKGWKILGTNKEKQKALFYQ